MIKLNNISYYFEDKKVLDSISFNVAKGEKVALLGCNGSGKSTLLRIIAGLYFTKEGSIYINNREISKKNINKGFRKSIGILFQNPESMIFNPTVRDEIAFSLKEFNMDSISSRVESISKSFEIEYMLNSNPLNLSGGEKQKLMLASILAYEPELLLLDEPTASVDPRTSGWIIDMLLEIDKTVIVATHDLSFAYEVSDRAIVLDENHQIIFDGEMDRLFEDLELLIRANLIHKHKHKHKNFIHSHYHKHF